MGAFQSHSTDLDMIMINYPSIISVSHDAQNPA